MGLTNTQVFQLNKLKEKRDDILNSLLDIENTLKIYFPEEFDMAIQFYIPQISTALKENEKWLSRGSYSLQNTIDNITQKCKIDSSDQSVTRYL